MFKRNKKHALEKLKNADYMVIWYVIRFGVEMKEVKNDL